MNHFTGEPYILITFRWTDGGATIPSILNFFILFVLSRNIFHYNIKSTIFGIRNKWLECIEEYDRIYLESIHVRA